jgi:predicted nucleic acid-binding protein
MKKFLLDTNSLSSLLKRHDKYHEIFTSRIKHFDFFDEEVEIYTSILSIFEMEYGAAHAHLPKLVKEARTALAFLKAQHETEKAMIEILPLTVRQAEIFGEIKQQFQNKREEIGEKIGKRSLAKHDLMIAATAIEFRATLVSQDKKIFALIQTIHQDFRWEDWVSY